MRGAARPRSRRTAAAPREGLVVAQHDLRTVRIDLRGVRVLLRYGFEFDGHERLPESVSVSGADVTAFFLTSTVHDRIDPTPEGFRVTRRWSILQAGRIRLNLTLDIPEATPAPGRAGGRRPTPRVYRYLFPGVASGPRAGESPLVLRGQRTALPSCLLLASSDVEICVLAEAKPTGELPSLALERAEDEGGPLLRIRFDTPPRDRSGARTRSRTVAHDVDPGDGTCAEIESRGKLERDLALQVVVAPPGAAYAAAFAALASRRARASEPRKWALREELRSLLGDHLLEEGGVCGLRTVPGADLLSASAGAALSVLLLRLYPGDDAMLELALRLADFCLTAQHPAGLFYERFGVRERSWLGLRRSVPGVAGRAPLLSIEESSRVAASLLDLAVLLERRGVAADRYGLAGRRMVDAFFDSRGVLRPPAAVMTPDGLQAVEEGLGSVRFLHPLLRVADVDRREKYRKAAHAIIGSRLDLAGTEELPSSREGREPDSRAILLLAEAAVEAADRRLRIPEPDALASRLLPWLRLRDAGGESPLPAAGALVDSFTRPRLMPRPCQIAFLCRRLGSLCAEPLSGLLAEHSRAALGSAGGLPLGTGSVARVRWASDAREASSGAGGAPASELAVGPVDARDFAAELRYALDLEEGGVW